MPASVETRTTSTIRHWPTSNSIHGLMRGVKGTSSTMRSTSVMRNFPGIHSLLAVACAYRSLVGFSSAAIGCAPEIVQIIQRLPAQELRNAAVVVSTVRQIDADIEHLKGLGQRRQ